jgi:hypothetical protein
MKKILKCIALGMGAALGWGAGGTLGRGGSSASGGASGAMGANGTGGAGGTTGGGSGGTTGGGSSGASGSVDSGTCSAGQKRCGGLCVLPQPSVGCSLTSCTPCPAPPPNGSGVCVGQTCDFQCLSGYMKSGSTCVPTGGDSGAACPPPYVFCDDFEDGNAAGWTMTRRHEGLSGQRERGVLGGL